MPKLKVLSLGDILPSSRDLQEPSEEQRSLVEDSIASLKQARMGIVVAWKFFRPDPLEEAQQ